MNDGAASVSGASEDTSSPSRLVDADVSPMAAWLFPGQGSQTVGMVQDLYEASATVRDLFVEASDRAAINIARLVFESPAEELQRTENAQPCLLTASIACARALAERGLSASVVAGHSLGEYSALVQAGVFSFGDAIYAVRQRGLAMAAAGGGTMAAILGLDDDVVEEVCAAIGKDVVPANYNAPGQVVISGTVAAVAAAGERAKAQGASRVVPLRVSGPFHSPLMAPVAERMGAVLRELRFAEPSIPVICNVDGQLHRRAAEFLPLLLRQLSSPVQWTAIMRQMRTSGIGRVYEVGPGRVLSGLLRQFDRSIEAVAVGTLEAIERLAAGA